jgi:hypothetical protein
MTGEKYGWEEKKDITLPFTLIDPLGNPVMGADRGDSPKVVPLVRKFTPAEVQQYESQGYTLVPVEPKGITERADLE